jgi:hypothetical protein
LWGAAGSGSNGSIVTTDLDVNFTYVNWYGGNWAQDPLNPYSVSGQSLPECRSHELALMTCPGLWKSAKLEP